MQILDVHAALLVGSWSKMILGSNLHSDQSARNWFQELLIDNECIVLLMTVLDGGNFLWIHLDGQTGTVAI
jgi:hypothetical protein